MKVENYDYKAEGLQEQNDKLEPRNTEVDPNTKRETDNLFSYLKNIANKVDWLNLAMLANQKRDEDQQRLLDEMKGKTEYVTTWISSWIEDRMKMVFTPEERIREMEKNHKSSENNIEAIA